MVQHTKNTHTLTPDYTIALRAPGSSHHEGYIYFTGFARLPGGAFIALGAINQPDEALAAGVTGYQGRMLLSRSDDGGATWRVLETDLDFGRHMLGGALFVHAGALYLFVSPGGDDGVISVARSDDEGATWSDWVEVIRVPRAAPADASERATLDDDPNRTEGQRWLAYCQNAMAVKDGRLYLAVSERCQDMAVARCELNLGLQNPRAWAISGTVPVSVPRALTPGLFPGRSMGTLEGNAIEINGRLRLLARQVVDRYGTSNVAAVFEVADGEDGPALSFTQLFPIPGAHGKFDIVYDAASRLYWMATNLESNSQNWTTHPSGCHKGRDRRFLTLWYALDALNWFPAGYVAAAEQMEQTFNYPCMLIDGDDLAILSRTTLDAKHYTSHDADLVTFHRVRHFRSLAMNIFPIP
ncbi:MAG: sialidase family protein [Armatimonadota bacterium]